jgi:hypothetical protein
MTIAYQSPITILENILARSVLAPCEPSKKPIPYSRNNSEIYVLCELKFSAKTTKKGRVKWTADMQASPSFQLFYAEGKQFAGAAEKDFAALFEGHHISYDKKTDFNAKVIISNPNSIQVLESLGFIPSVEFSSGDIDCHLAPSGEMVSYSLYGGNPEERSAIKSQLMLIFNGKSEIKLDRNKPVPKGMSTAFFSL